MLAFKPQKHLASHVDTLWVTNGPLETRATFEYYPVPTSDVLIILDERTCEIFHCSAATTRGTVTASAGKAYFALRLRPGMGADLFGTWETRRTDATTSLDRLFGIPSDSLGQMLLEAATPRRQADLLFSTLQNQRPGSAGLAHGQLAGRIIETTGGGIPVANVARELGISPRQMERQVRLFTGLTPKGLARSVRLQHCFERLHHGGFANLASLAQDLGYMDQPHFIRDFKSMTGKTPGQYLAGTRMAAHVTDVAVPAPDRPLFQF
ncbi:helix-turn-helix domain-containing protein [Salidesulfovibrio onnuriiensis]|uniref:helix-turn-helix domain-containing protein n=1 Tax=Salidesulfovibrio onnuriiensis TaxID=2583823 RepID=UPI0011CBC0A2|nr:helix-turn-helix domain-containing protein [Salidesulfovibrio onnuriiensis]